MMVLRRGRPIVGGVSHRVVRILTVLVVVAKVMSAVEAVRHVAGRARRRVVAEQVPEQAPEPVHRKGL